MKKKLFVFTTLCFMFTLSGCKNKQTEDTTAPSGTTEEVVDVIPTGGIYTVYDGNDELKFEEENMWTAILTAGKSSKSSDRYYVVNQEDQTIYKYSLVKFYMYQGTEYIGETIDKDQAILWAKEHSNSYVVNGNGYEFVALGETVVPESKVFSRGYELNAGSYLYLFSKKYNQNENNIGYAYMNFTLRFSEAELTYATEDTEQGWNAYVFVNTMMDTPYQNCDIGIMNGWENHKGWWTPVFNFNGFTYTPDQSAVITKMEYDEETNTYGNADDLFFEIYATNEKYVLKITNLTTNEVSTFTCENPKLAGNADKTYLLLAASYCPVQFNSEIWNPRSGATFTNIIFENVKVAQYRQDNDYSNATLVDFGPDSESLNHGLIYGNDNASWSYGTRESSGTYLNGSTYAAGDSYYIANIFYDNRTR